MRNFLYGSVILMMLIGACKKETPLEKPVNITQLLNVEYGPDPANKLDLYLPEERTKDTKVILFLYGDQFFSGDKSKFTDLAKFFRDKGYVTAAINYTMTATSGNSIQAQQVNDLAKTIDYISSKASELNYSADSFGVLGKCTGAYIGLLYTYKFNKDNKVKTIVSMAGLTNLSELAGVESELASIEMYIGSSLLADPMAYKVASPVFYVKPSSKPTLLFHGKLDHIVPEQQARCLKNKLDEANVDNKLVVYEDTGHEVVSLNNTVSFVGEVDAWFKAKLK